MNAATEGEVASFESHRRALTGLAYRMLGSRAEAEDVVQDAYLRWHEADHDAIEEPRRYLGTIVTRLCLDRMKSARARREVYVGQWLPEPVVDETLDADTAGISPTISPSHSCWCSSAYRRSSARVFCCMTFSVWTLPKWRAR